MHIINWSWFIMYEALIKEYLKRLSLKDINDFAVKNKIILQKNEDKIIYDFIMENWKEVYKGNAKLAFEKLKKNVSNETYNNVITLYNQFKNKIK